MHIASAGNSDTACLQALFDKGYRVICDDEYTAIKLNSDGTENTFSGDTAMEVLGLVTIGEMWGENWQKKGLGRSAWERIEYGVG